MQLQPAPRKSLHCTGTAFSLSPLQNPVSLVVNGTSISASMLAFVSSNTQALSSVSFSNMVLSSPLFDTDTPLIELFGIKTTITVDLVNIVVRDTRLFKLIEFEWQTGSLSNVTVRNVHFSSDSLISAGQTLALNNFAATGVRGTNAAVAIVTSSPDGSASAIFMNITSVIDSDVPAFVVQNSSAVTVLNGKFAGINTGPRSKGGAFACTGGQLALSTVLITNCTAGAGAAGLDTNACLLNANNVFLHNNYEKTNANDCNYQ
jgi:hypothetical protein